MVTSSTMRAWTITCIGCVSVDSAPLTLQILPRPVPGPHEVRIKVTTCGVCHTELDEIEGRTPPPRLPVVPGHEVVGHIDMAGSAVTRWTLGERVGVGWIHHSSGSRTENLSSDFCATGRDVDGGYAEYMIAHQDYTYRIPSAFSDAQAAPLLCAGAVGYRALMLAGLKNGQRLGLMGFGGSNHLVLQMALCLFPDSGIFVFARDAASRRFATELGAAWSGDINEASPDALDAIIDTTPVWTPVVAALANLAPGGRLIINAIRKEDTDRSVLSEIVYHQHLWMEREIKTVANITHDDLQTFLPLAAPFSVQPHVQAYEFGDANRAVCELKFQNVRGAKVLLIS